MLKLPNKPRLTRHQLLKRIEKAFDSNKIIGERSLNDFADCPVKLIAIRGYFLNSMGKRWKNDRGIYDDAVFVTTDDGDFISFNANVDPSRVSKGKANLVSNQIVWYRPGKHGISRGGGYPAFRQNSVCVVKRDGNTGNGKPLGKGLFQDSSRSRFWINLHRGGYKTTSSAGCQTIPPQQWVAFRDLVKMYLSKYELKSFPYLLLPPIR